MNGLWNDHEAAAFFGDVTPAEPVTALITEKGVVHAPSRERVSALFR